MVEQPMRAQRAYERLWQDAQRASVQLARAWEAYQRAAEAGHHNKAQRDLIDAAALAELLKRLDRIEIRALVPADRVCIKDVSLAVKRHGG